MSIETGKINITDSHLIEGNAANPSDYDVLVVTGRLPVGQPVPEGWRVLTGNHRDSRVAIVCLRYETANLSWS